jgi:superfamily II DNA/RNA helicase
MAIFLKTLMASCMAQREEALGKFTKESEIMIATDAAGEGLDMQFATNVEINYDMP